MKVSEAYAQPKKGRPAQSRQTSRADKRVNNHVDKCPAIMKWIEAITHQGEESLEQAMSADEFIANVNPAINLSSIIKKYGKTVIFWSHILWRKGRAKASKKLQVGTLKEVLKRRGWMYIKVIEMSFTPPTDDELLQTIRDRIRNHTKHWYRLSTLTELWRMCGRVGRLQADAERKQARLHLTAALRKKGVVANPWKAAVIKIPKDPNISSREVKNQMRRILKLSTLPRVIARGIRIHVVQEKAPTATSILQDFKQHILKMDKGKLKCTCKKCPNHWQRIDGHVAFRTRETHLEPGMLKTNLKSPLFLDSKDLGDGISRGIWEATRRYTPVYALTRVSVDTNTCVKRKKQEPPKNLTARSFRRLGRQTAHLVKTPIDKAPGELMFS